MIYVFGEYEFAPQLYELRQAGKLLKVEPKVFDVLAYLVQRRDNVVSKQELRTRVARPVHQRGNPERLHHGGTESHW